MHAEGFHGVEPVAGPLGRDPIARSEGACEFVVVRDAGGVELVLERGREVRTEKRSDLRAERLHLGIPGEVHQPAPADTEP
jgi:hypothetical protein